MVVKQQREHLVQAAEFLIARAPQIHYVQARPMPTAHLGETNTRRLLIAGGHISMDCSESVTLLFRWAGLRDPNGLGYDGYGNSGEMWHHLSQHYSNPIDAHPGALVTYGEEGWEHVCMVLQQGEDPWLFSHGGENGPLRIRLSNESRAHPGQPRTFLDIHRL